MREGQKSGKIKRVLMIITVIIFVGAIFSGIYFYSQYRKVVKNPEIVTKQETIWILEKINKLVDLPQDETPTVATVLDKEKLKDQDFFKKAENGDKVIVYMKAKKAVLYRPNTNKVIEIAPVYTDETQQAAESGAITLTPKIALFNGTTISGLTNSAETKIKGILPNVEIAQKDNAKKNDYKKTIVVDLNGSLNDQAKSIADALGGEIGTLPDGEDKPNADILVIIAK